MELVHTTIETGSETGQWSGKQAEVSIEAEMEGFSHFEQA